MGYIINGINSCIESRYCYGYTSRIMTTTRLGFDGKQMSYTTRWRKDTKLYSAVKVIYGNRNSIEQALH